MVPNIQKPNSLNLITFELLPLVTVAKSQEAISNASSSTTEELREPLQPHNSNTSLHLCSRSISSLLLRSQISTATTTCFTRFPQSLSHTPSFLQLYTLLLPISDLLSPYYHIFYPIYHLILQNVTCQLSASSKCGSKTG